MMYSTFNYSHTIAAKKAKKVSKLECAIQYIALSIFITLLTIFFISLF